VGISWPRKAATSHAIVGVGEFEEMIWSSKTSHHGLAESCEPSGAACFQAKVR
jgi:hypothetical protein